MSLFAMLLKAFEPMFQSQKDLDDEYLAEAASVYDLERRMRAIDTRAPKTHAGLNIQTCAGS